MDEQSVDRQRFLMVVKCVLEYWPPSETLLEILRNDVQDGFSSKNCVATAALKNALEKASTLRPTDPPELYVTALRDVSNCLESGGRDEEPVGQAERTTFVIDARSVGDVEGAMELEADDKSTAGAACVAFDDIEDLADIESSSDNGFMIFDDLDEYDETIFESDEGRTDTSSDSEESQGFESPYWRQIAILANVLAFRYLRVPVFSADADSALHSMNEDHTSNTWQTPSPGVWGGIGDCILGNRRISECGASAFLYTVSFCLQANGDFGFSIRRYSCSTDVAPTLDQSREGKVTSRGFEGGLSVLFSSPFEAIRREDAMWIFFCGRSFDNVLSAFSTTPWTAQDFQQKSPCSLQLNFATYRLRLGCGATNQQEHYGSGVLSEVEEHCGPMATFLLSFLLVPKTKKDLLPTVGLDDCENRGITELAEKALRDLRREIQETLKVPYRVIRTMRSSQSGERIELEDLQLLLNSVLCRSSALFGEAVNLDEDAKLKQQHLTLLADRLSPRVAGIHIHRAHDWFMALSGLSGDLNVYLREWYKLPGAVALRMLVTRVTNRAERKLRNSRHQGRLNTAKFANECWEELIFLDDGTQISCREMRARLMLADNGEQQGLLQAFEAVEDCYLKLAQGWRNRCCSVPSKPIGMMRWSLPSANLRESAPGRGAKASGKDTFMFNSAMYVLFTQVVDPRNACEERRAPLLDQIRDNLVGNRIRRVASTDQIESERDTSQPCRQRALSARTLFYLRSNLLMIDDHLDRLLHLVVATNLPREEPWKWVEMLLEIHSLLDQRSATVASLEDAESSALLLETQRQQDGAAVAGDVLKSMQGKGETKPVHEIYLSNNAGAGSLKEADAWVEDQNDIKRIAKTLGSQCSSAPIKESLADWLRRGRMRCTIEEVSEHENCGWETLGRAVHRCDANKSSWSSEKYADDGRTAVRRALANEKVKKYFGCAVTEELEKDIGSPFIMDDRVLKAFALVYGDVHVVQGFFPRGYHCSGDWDGYPPVRIYSHDEDTGPRGAAYKICNWTDAKLERDGILLVLTAHGDAAYHLRPTRPISRPQAVQRVNSIPSQRSPELSGDNPEKEAQRNLAHMELDPELRSVPFVAKAESSELDVPAVPVSDFGNTSSVAVPRSENNPVRAILHKRRAVGESTCGHNSVGAKGTAHGGRTPPSHLSFHDERSPAKAEDTPVRTRLLLLLVSGFALSLILAVPMVFTRYHRHGTFVPDPLPPSCSLLRGTATLRGLSVPCYASRSLLQPSLYPTVMPSLMPSGNEPVLGGLSDAPRLSLPSVQPSAAPSSVLFLDEPVVPSSGSVDLGSDEIVVRVPLPTPLLGESGAVNAGSGPHYKLPGLDTWSGTQLGHSVAVSEDFVVAGAPEDPVAPMSGSAQIFRQSNLVWTQIAKLVPSDGALGDRFGFSVAVNGPVVAIGASEHEHNGFAAAGAVYIFESSDGGKSWAEAQKLVAPDAQSGDQFGRDIAMSDDVLIIGAPLKDSTGEEDSGAAYIFRRENGTWNHEATLLGHHPRSSLDADDRFGWAVAIEGGRALVGAYKADLGTTAFAGVAFVFENSTGTWSHTQRLSAQGFARSGDEFGASVALSGDTAVVGARASNSGAGAVFVFEYISDSWTKVKRIAAASNFDRFGFSVGIDDATLLVGDPFFKSNDVNTGLVLEYTKQEGTWGYKQNYSAGVESSESRFGYDVSCKGRIAAIGAQGGGAVYTTMLKET